MKTVSKALFILSIIFLLSSCSKEQPKTILDSTTTPKQQVGGNGVGTSVSMSGGGCCESFVTKLDASAGEWCCNEGTNCAVCVTITGTIEAILDELVISGSDAVADYFNGDDWQVVFPTLEEMNPDMLEKLQSGNYILEKLYDSEINKIIYKASNSEEDYFALPMILE